MGSHPAILLVDDDPGLLKLLRLRLETSGYKVLTAEDAASALSVLQRSTPNLVITDLRMAGMDGMGLLQEIHRRRTGMPVLIITAHGTIPDAVEATQSGAFAFITKPIDKQELLNNVEQALKTGGAPAGDDAWKDEIVGASPKMLEVLAQIRRVAETDASVLITGASGTGKELIAQCIHGLSRRRNGKFVAVNCGAIPADLIEAELFGYKQGAFTGALRSHPGLLMTAGGGTLFLDEIGDMPLHLQVKLLRILEERKVRPLGGLEDKPVDIRVISATNHDLRSAFAKGAFREDLYYRLNVIEINVPSLEERVEDIPLLVNHKLEELIAGNSGKRKVLAPKAMELLIAATWPGNIRQLFNTIEQAYTLSSGPVISAIQIKHALGDRARRLTSLQEAREEFTRNYLTQLLKITEGNVSYAARLAKRNRTNFYKLLNRYGIEPEQFKD